MGNSQFSSSKDVEGGAGRGDGGYGGFEETRTAPGAPGPFSETSFASALRAVDSRSMYTPSGGASGKAPRRPRGVEPEDDMDVESKADGGVEEDEEEEVCCYYSYISR